MGDIAKAAIGILKIVVVVSLVGITGAIILATMSDDFEQFMSDAIGEALTVFGIGPEDIVHVNVHDQLLFEDSEDVASMLTQLAITHSKTDTGIITLLTQSSNNVRGAYHNYFYNGENDYSHGLPETNLQANVIPTDKILNIINNQYGVTATKVTAKRNVPTKQEYVSSVLYDLYDYSYSNNIMIYTGVEYSVTDINYNYTTDNYDIDIGRKNIERTTTTTSVSSIPDTPPVPPATEPTPATTELVTTTVIVERVLAEGTVVISSSSSSTQVPIGSGSNSSTVSEVEGTPYQPQVLSILAPEPNIHYIMMYHTGDINNVNYWVYEVGSGTYLELDEASQYITNLEMLPIVSIRNNKVSITEDKLSEEYLETKEILGTVGLDPDLLVEGIEDSPDIDNIESAHVHFGVDPKVEDPIIARSLFELFDYVHTDSSLYEEDNSSYMVTMSEGVYNASLLWKEFNRTVNTGNIGELNTYTNTISTKDIEVEKEVVNPINGVITIEIEIETVDTLLLRKQITDTLYVEYEITYLTSTTFIKNGGYSNSTTGTLAEGVLIIPISKFFIDKLTPIEQMDLFSKSLRLSVYAIQVQHLKYYETAKFASFVKIAMYIIAIVIFIVTWYTGGATSAAFMTAVKSLLIVFAASYAFKLLLESTDNPVLKAIYAVLYIAIMVYSGTFDPGSAGLTTANTIIFSVSTFTQTFSSITQDKIQLLDEEIYGARIASDEANRKLEEAISTEIDYFSTVQALEVSTIEHIPPFMDGVDAMMYKAVELNYKAIDLTVHDFYTHQFDYQKYYQSGVV